MLTRVVSRIALIGLIAGISSIGYAADTDENYTGKWRNSDDVVTGWDWTLPTGVKPARNSGIFNSNSDVPKDFPGNHLRQVNARWKDLEPSEGKYDLSSIIRELNNPEYDGIMLNVRGMVTAATDSNGNQVSDNAVTAPNWLARSVPTTQESMHNGVRITNMNIYDPRVKSRLIKLIKAIGDSEIPGHPKLVAQIVHGVSSTRGEEWTGAQASRPEAERAMEEIIEAWSVAYGPNAKKLAWLKETPKSLFDAAVNKGGMGIRGGAIEKWLRRQYTPGITNESGQSLSSGGYLSVDENFAPIRYNRHFADQNEAYRSTTEAPRAKWDQNYRMANLRMLQMRRNVAWTVRNSTLNPKMLNWMSLQLGKTVKSTPDAWVALIRSWARSNNEDREINNLERWAYQRDTNGYQTRPALKSSHGKNMSGNSLPDALWYVDLARTGERIGIALDDRFLSGGPHAVAVKVTWYDSANETWSLVYNKGNGGTGSRSINGKSTNTVRTATFFLNDFAAPERGFDNDFTLESPNGRTPFMFVRVIRLGEGSGGAGGSEIDSLPARPAPPTNVTVTR
jgi:hypothetical protein